MSLDFENFDRSDCTILTKAVKSGYVQNVEKVISRLKDIGEDITENLYTTDRQGYTAIHHAVLQTDVSILQKLLPYADERCLNTQSHDRTTPLLLLCKQDSHTACQEKMLVYLLAAGADPNRPLSDPFSRPLLCVLEQKWWKAAVLLLEGGADPWLNDFEHWRWMPICFSTEQPDIMKLIFEKGKHESQPLHKIFGLMIEYIPDDTAMEIYTQILSHYSVDLDMSLLLKVSEKPYMDIVTEILPALKPSCNPYTSRDEVIQFLGKIFQSLIELTPSKLRRFLSAYFGSVKKKAFSTCYSGVTLMPLVWACREVESLKILLEVAEQSKLPATDWQMTFVDMARLSFFFLEKRSNCIHCTSPPKEMVSYDVLGVTASAVTTVEAFKPNISVLLQAGVKPSMQSLAAYVENAVSRSADLPHRPHELSLLPQLARDCCASGSCWFRDPFIINTCERLLFCGDTFVDHTACVAAFLWLGVDIRDILSCLSGSRNLNSLSSNMLTVLSMFDTCRRVEYVRFTNPPPSLASCDLRSGPGSLKHLCRLAVRSALGLCRVEEKLKSLSYIIPPSMTSFICFKKEIPFIN